MNQTIEQLIEKQPTLRIGEFSENTSISGQKFIFWNNVRIAKIQDGKITTLKSSNHTNFMIYDAVGISRDTQ